ncbi:phosphatidate cytidylyltransferase [Pelistega ratti]|uniref:phosphatidate cytidylyltransferase n=1 Tax=Pelistega ratti TaxID=2652177 RepID=UPI001916AE7A|nr:CDP-archaeol synthase [Pelistega ratti]
MLIPRVITAIVLLVILAILLSLSNPFYFAIFLSVASALTIFEWLRISLPTSKKGLKAALVAIVSFIAFMSLYSLFIPLNGDELAAIPDRLSLFYANPWKLSIFSLLMVLTFFLSFIWLLIIPIVLYRGETRQISNSYLHSIFAVMASTAAWISLLTIYLLSGTWFLLSFLIIIWCADIFAYFGGRYFGGEKLAPTISPGKTRSGAICGLLSVAIWIIISAYIDHSFSAFLVHFMGFGGAVIVGLLLGIVSIFGDLYESLLKRRASVKDSSQLLPGHGGVWDRLDSVIAVTPLAMNFIFLFNI